MTVFNYYKRNSFRKLLNFTVSLVNLNVLINHVAFYRYITAICRIIYEIIMIPSHISPVLCTFFQTQLHLFRIEPKKEQKRELIIVSPFKQI